MKVPLYAQLYTHLIDDIRSGRLRPGDRVATEKQLAAQFGVSRITSKRALEELVRLRVVERTRGKGSFVAATLPDLDRLNLSGGDEALPSRGGSTKTATVCLVMPDFSDAYGVALLHAVEARVSSQNALLVLKRTYGEREQEQAAIRRFVESGGDGLMVMPVHGEFYNEQLLRLVVESFPLVMVDRYLKGIATCAVYTDNRQAAYELTTHLLTRGHEHLAFLSPPLEGTSSIEERFDGFSAACAEHGIAPRSQYKLTSLLSTLPRAFHGEKILTDEEKLRTFMVENPQITAFLAEEYNIALILAQVLASLGKHVPADCSVVCFDSPEDPFGPPAFTHIEQDESTMGEMAVDLLMAQLRGEPVPPRTMVPFRLVEGRSTRHAGHSLDPGLAATAGSTLTGFPALTVAAKSSSA